MAGFKGLGLRSFDAFDDMPVHVGLMASGDIAGNADLQAIVEVTAHGHDAAGQVEV